MKRYETYKDSGIQWVGEIPSHWEIVKLRYTGTFENGLTYSTGDIVEDDGILVLRSSNIQNEHITFDDCVYVNSVPKELMVSKGDIIICSRNGSAALIGKCAIIEDDVKASFGAFMMRYRANINYKFAFYLFLSAVANYRGLFSTSTINQLTMSIINQMQVALPSDTEQVTIAAFLDHKVGQIDATIAEKEQMLEDLKNYRSAIISEAVTKGLDKNVEMKDSGIEWIGIIPKHWNVSNIGRLFNIKAGGDAKPEFYSSTKDDVHKYPVYTNTREADHVYAFSSYAPFSGNSITVTGRGDIGHAIFRSNEYDAIIRLLVLQPKIEDIIDSRYFAYFIDEKIHFFTDSAAVGQLSAIQISPYKICFPPIKEQRAISNYLDERIAQIDVLTKEIDSQISDLKSYKSALITEAVTGKIDLREWKPKEENV